MTRLNLRWLFICLIAGLLLGVVSAHPLTWTAVGTVAGCALAFLVPPKKKSCCH